MYVHTYIYIHTHTHTHNTHTHTHNTHRHRCVCAGALRRPLLPRELEEHGAHCQHLPLEPRPNFRRASRSGSWQWHEAACSEQVRPWRSTAPARRSTVAARSACAAGGRFAPRLPVVRAATSETTSASTCPCPSA
jgi:hypothetical protein